MTTPSTNEELDKLLERARLFADDFGISYDKITVSRRHEYISYKTNTGGTGGWSEGTPAVQVLVRIINKYAALQAHITTKCLEAREYEVNDIREMFGAEISPRGFDYLVNRLAALRAQKEEE